MKHRNKIVNGYWEKLLKLERKRDRFVREGNLDGFVKTYREKFPEVDNLNSEVRWDNLLKEKRAELEVSPIYQDKIKIIAKPLREKEGKILDIGFGYAVLEKALQKSSSKLQFYGLDISKEAVSSARRNLLGNYDIGSIFALPYKNSFFDFVLALDVLEHISSDKIFKAYVEIKRVLRPSGTFIVSIPLNENLAEMVAKGKNPNGHLRTYTPKILEAELKFQGFEVQRRRLLWAFGKMYGLKTLIAKLIPGFRKPNALIVEAQKQKFSTQNKHPIT